MSGSVNKVILVGHLGRDPEISTLNSGAKAATLSLATSESWRDKATGERKERTEWHRVVIFAEPLVELAGKYLRKGSKVYIEGMQATRRWTDKAGVERFMTETLLRPYRGELQLLDKAERNPAPEEDSYGTTRQASLSGPSSAANSAVDIDDAIPF